MVEKWDLVLRHRDLQDPWDPQYLRIPWTPRTFGPPGTSGPLGNYLYRLKSRFYTPRNFDTEVQTKDLPKLYNWTITNQSGKLRVPSEVILFIELLTMIISGQSPPLLPSSYVTVINRNDNQRHLNGYTWIEKISQFLTLQYVKMSITPFFCYRYTKENKHFHYIHEINHSLQKQRSSIINVWQNTEFASVAGNNLRENSI